MLTETSLPGSSCGWLDQKVNDQMNKALGGNLDHYKEIVEDTKTALHKLEEGLKVFNAVILLRTKVSTFQRSMLLSALIIPTNPNF